MIRVLRNALIVTLVTAIALAAGEVGFRWLDNFAFGSVALTPRVQVPRGSMADIRAWASARQHVERLAVAEGIDRRWFDLDPSPVSRHSTNDDAVLAERYSSHPGWELRSVYEWNRNYLLSQICGPVKGFEGLDEIAAFEPLSDAIQPHFRFPQNASLPSGLVTNEFGWRGAPVALNRSARTIRIAFVGASTTVNHHQFRFSYPEHVGQWLRVWAQSENLPVDFEVINAGREGSDSQDFDAIVRDEIAPLDPDFVVYYEGSNQFWPIDFVKWSGGEIPTKPTITFRPPGWLEAHSAVARRVALALPALSRGDEPQKPFGRVDWPAAIDEFDPDVTAWGLPLNLPTILGDLELIQKKLAESHATLIPSSFVWFAHEGMRLELPRQSGIYLYLNDTFWPFPYAHIRRMADFQNRVFKKFATSAGLPFIDVARDYPQDADLFVDAIHMNEAGLKIQGWIVLQQLVPILRARLKAGDLPRPVRQPLLSVHPAFAKPAQLRSKTEWMRECPTAGTLDEKRIADVQQIQQVLERYYSDHGRYPAPPRQFVAWGQCTGNTPTNWIPNGTDFRWSAKYIAQMPNDPNFGCNYPFDAEHVGNTQYIYYTEGGTHYVLLAGLQDESNPLGMKRRGTADLPEWFTKVVGPMNNWWGGTYIVVGGR